MRSTRKSMNRRTTLGSVAMPGRSGIVRLLVPVACVLAVSACAAQPKPERAVRDTHERLNGVLWVQSSAEYKAIVASTFLQATARVLALKKDFDAGRHVESAALEQPGRNTKKLRPAVIVDVDETLIDNSPMSGELIEERVGWDQALWDKWVRMRRAEFLLGAEEFVDAVRKAGVEVVYVTNRKASEEADTIADLKPLEVTPGIILASEETDPKTGEVWTSEKKSRREAVARDWWILAMVGDDLADFLPGVRSRVTPDQRVASMKKYVRRFGDRWFLLPNPIYGSWEHAIVNPEEPDERQLADKHRRLRRFPLGSRGPN